LAERTAGKALAIRRRRYYRKQQKLSVLTFRGSSAKIRQNGGQTALHFFNAVGMQTEEIAKTMLGTFRRSLTRDRRLGIALMGSALLHALTLLTLANYSIQSRAFTRPVFAPLSVQLERVAEPPAEKPVAVIQKKALLHLNPSATSANVAPPADMEPSLPEPGVSIIDTLYLKPFGARVSSPLLMSGEFRRSSEISEVPLMLRMRVPGYPREAREQ